MKNFAIVFLMSIFASSCKTTGLQLGDNSGLPGKSIATISPALYQDAMTNISKWLEQQQSCKKFSVSNTVSVSSEGDVIMDGNGRLFSGVISEEWTISACEKIQKLALVFKPDGNGGNYIAIAKLNK